MYGCDTWRPRPLLVGSGDSLIPLIVINSMSRSIVATRRWWFLFSGLMVGAALASLLAWGLRFGVDFTGGSLLAFRFEQRPAVVELVQTVTGAGVETGEPVIQPVGDTEVQIRTKELSEADYQTLVAAIEAKHGQVEELRFDTIGPVIGAELRSKSLQGVVVALLLILFYIAYTFRKVAAPVVSWKYGMVTMLAAAHDVVIPLGVFAALGHFRGLQVGTPFVAAVLTILGYSITDTIVVMDRVRENLPRMKASFEEVVDFSLRQTALRSIYTSLTTLIALLAVFFFGGASLHEFTLAMIIGIAVGTYSSVFVAPMALVAWNAYDQARKKS